MARYGRGLICLTLTEERADYLRLFPDDAAELFALWHRVYRDDRGARRSHDRDLGSRPRPHHPHRYRSDIHLQPTLPVPAISFLCGHAEGGVLVRAGQTEASVDLARMAGLNPSGVICEIMRDDGEMARIPDLIPFCREHGLRILTVAELIRYRLRHERYIVRAGETRIQTQLWRVPHDCLRERGQRRREPYRSCARRPLPGAARHSTKDRSEGAITRSAPAAAVLPSVLVVCTRDVPPGDIFAADCHCREVLDRSMRMIAEEGCGVLLYLHNTSCGFEIDHTPMSPHPPSSRDGAVIPANITDRGTPSVFCIRDLRTRKVAGSQRAHPAGHRPWRPNSLGPWDPAHPSLSNTPMHIPALEGFGLEIVEQVPIPVEECSRV